MYNNQVSLLIYQCLTKTIDNGWAILAYLLLEAFSITSHPPIADNGLLDKDPSFK